MGFLSVLGMAQRLVKERVTAGCAVIDATCGNGVDTQFMVELVGPRGTVYAFDIQAAALERTQQRIAAAYEQFGGSGRAQDAGGQGPLRLVHASHAEMDRHVQAQHHGKITAVMFNLGYLPGADTSVITEPASTLAALESSLSLLRPGGIITTVLYPGHPGGLQEAEAVTSWASALSQTTAQTLLYRMVQKKTAPFIIAVEKK